MKQPVCILFVALMASVVTEGQVTIVADDMFNQPGQYFQAFSNDFDATSTSPSSFSTSNGTLQGSAGQGQIWDFSKGPTNVIYRFDYLAATNVDSAIAMSFPQATLVERQTDQATGSQQYLFFEQVPDIGRRVYGFYAELPLYDQPMNPFANPIIDFPARISYGDKWSTSATYSNAVVVGDPIDPEGGSTGIDIIVTQDSDLQADAAGTIVLPEELGGFGQGLRINESVTVSLQYFDDTDGTYKPLETDYARNFYWLMPGRGMVAALASTQNSGVLGGAAGLPPDNFPTATQFWRMFDTNKKPSTSTNSCVNPDPVAKIRIQYSDGQVLLSWSKANCATQYRVEYATNAADSASWKQFGNLVTNQFIVLDSTRLDQQRFYRVISMK